MNEKSVNDSVQFVSGDFLPVCRVLAALGRSLCLWQPHVILDLHNYPSRRRHRRVVSGGKATN